MDQKEAPADHPGLADESRRIWEDIAAWWDERLAGGNRWQTFLIGPAVERLLALRSGESLLDLACGNGWLARRMAQQGARVVACDFSAAFLERARAHGAAGDRIDYRLVDLTDEEQLGALGSAEFDAAVCNMGIMDMASISPMLRAIRRVLKPRGRFVFSITHPCFHTTGTMLVAERNDLSETYSVRVCRYANLAPQKGHGFADQPSPHYYFDRPLSVLLGACFNAGLVLDGLEEPTLASAASGAPQPLGWPGFNEMPPILVARLRPSQHEVVA